MENSVDTNKNKTNCCKQNGKLTNNNYLNSSESSKEQDLSDAETETELQEKQNEEHDEDDESGAVSYDKIAFHNEGLIEEIILLPNNLSDDDTNSDEDCIYAYRGRSGAGSSRQSPEPPGLPVLDDPDDPDFLEMDFDPEPNSELENFNQDEHFNHLESNFFSLKRQNGSSESNKSQQPLSPILPDEALEVERKNTGAKPKKRTTSSTQSGALCQMAEQKECTELQAFDQADVGTCLDCAEVDFIRQTKPDATVEAKCAIHCCKRTNQLDRDNESPFSSFNLRNHAILQQSQPPSKPKEYMVTLYSINCDYQTIVEAANLIGVPINTEILKQYFEGNIVEEDTATMSVPEYLLYKSKRNCNYKKLIELIKTASQEPIDIHFYPVNTHLLIDLHLLQRDFTYNPNY